MVHNGSIETNVSDKSCFHKDKNFWLSFPSLLECDKPQRTFYKGPQAILTNAAKFLKAFFYELRVCWIKKNLRRKGNLSSEKIIWPIFPVLSSKKNAENNILVSIWYSGDYSGAYKRIFRTWEVVQNKKFLEKKQKFQWRKNFGLFFP